MYFLVPIRTRILSLLPNKRHNTEYKIHEKKIYDYGKKANLKLH